MTFQTKKKQKPKQSAIKRGLSSHHAAAKMRLDLFRIEIFDFQNVQLGFGSFQDPLAVQHALLKVCRLLEQLILCGDLPKLSLQCKKTEKKQVCEICLKAQNGAWPDFFF